MRPIARWTIGKTTRPGEETLRCSVRRFRLLYPEFDLVICYNNLSEGQKASVVGLGVPVHEQRAEELDYPLADANGPLGDNYSMPGWGWKLVPPRLRPDTHELWIDNDIVFQRRMPSLERWLASDRTLISTGHRREYGVFDGHIADPTPYCAGFFGLPPHFDFAGAIGRHSLLLNGVPLGHYDEQGLTVSAVLEGDPVVVPMSELAIVKELGRPFAPAMHFIGVNRTHRHKAWEEYKCYTLI
jgi:hypothetical protein